MRITIEQNFEQLEDVFARYGLRIDRRAAQRRAMRLRASRGWRVSDREAEGEPSSPQLRVVERRLNRSGLGRDLAPPGKTC